MQAPNGGLTEHLYHPDYSVSYILLVFWQKKGAASSYQETGLCVCKSPNETSAVRKPPASPVSRAQRLQKSSLGLGKRRGRKMSGSTEGRQCREEQMLVITK